MSFSYLNIELYYSAIENFHTFVYIYRAVRVTAKATDYNFFFLKSTLNSNQFLALFFRCGEKYIFFKYLP